MQSIKPEGQTLIVLPVSSQEMQTDGGIVINDTVLQKGKILAVSDELKEIYEEGQTIIFPENSGISVRHKDQQCLWVKPTILDYVGIVTETNSKKTIRPAMSTPPFKLFKFPSRGRPERFFTSLDSIVNNISDKDYYHIACTLDEDDLTMNNKEVIDRINSYKNISIQWGTSTSKINAVNRSMPDIPFDILINMSDDMVFNLFGFDVQIGIDMATHFPNFDGLLHYPDQDAREFLATMYIAGVNFYRKFNCIYDPRFKSVWCDNLIQTVAQHMNKYKYCGYQINLHLNPAYGHLPKDEMFERQQGDWEHDQTLHDDIIAKGIPEYLKQFNL